ncbi:MAG: SDR family NAD(P)-dependent oxidoreductase, partial [Acidobacteriota bacterium]
MRLKNKVALVTGGSQGLGAEIVRRFLEEGAVVFIGDIHSPDGTGGEGATFLSLNVTSEVNWERALKEIQKRCGRLDILVNNAGINIRKDIETMPEESLDSMLAVNIKGPFLGIKHALPVMRESGGGVILNMASVCGLIGHRYTHEAYTTTKGAVTLLSRAIASRYAGDNIRCNSVHPSTVDTPMLLSV